MGWQDREYNAGREQMNAYFANPAAMLQYALPIYKSARLYIHLSIWMMLAALFVVIGDVRGGAPWFYIPIDLALLLAVVLWHELGHRVFARMVGGNHWEWVLWPLGGMIAPTAPRRPWAKFVANVGGIVFNLFLVAAVATTVLMIPGVEIAIQRVLFIPLGVTVFPASLMQVVSPLGYLLMHMAGSVMTQSLIIILVNLFPCYWFDGGPLWESVLWPKLGQWKAVRITCLAGMILSVPLFVLSVFNRDFLGMIMCVLIFSDCFRRRQMLAAAGPGVMEEDDGPTYNYMDSPGPRRKKLKKRWFSAARKKASREQAEQAKIDAILAKVKERGLHSLSWWEKRTLRKATERQRQRDLAERL